MSFGLLPILLLVAFLGIGALFAEQAHVTSVSVAKTYASTAAASFLLYRNAVLAYLEANRGAPAASGSLASSAVVPFLPAGTNATNFPAGAGNAIVVGAGMIRTAYIFATAVPGELGALGPAFQGNASFGMVANGQWSSSSLGIAGAVPTGVPNGDIISVVQVGD